MNDTVENRIGERGIAQVFVPAIDRQLARDDCRSVAVLVIEDLELEAKVLSAPSARAG